MLGPWKHRDITTKRVTTIGTCNVRTLNTVQGTDLLVRELSCFRWDVIGLAETHWTGTQKCVVNGCKIINSGGDGKHAAGVALELSSSTPKWPALVQTCKWLNYSSQISDSDTSSNYHTGFSTNSRGWRGCHQQYLHRSTEQVSRAHTNGILIILGDMDARAGSRERMNCSVMGTYGFRQRNDRGEQLLDLCYINDFYISNTKFK